MKKIFFVILFCQLFNTGNSQNILNVPVNIQEYDQWCWAGCSKSILDYYGFSQSQCEIAEYARTAITWTSYGSSDCCVNATLGCNYWNYNYGFAGSIQDILVNFGGITNTGASIALSLTNSEAQIDMQRPFVARWGWYAGGGHFVVVHGYDLNQNLYYMDPWFGEGAKVANYNSFVDDGVHQWTHTNILQSSPDAIAELLPGSNIAVFPNPFRDIISIRMENIGASITLTDSKGAVVHTDITECLSECDLDLGHLASGVYFLEINSGKSLERKKLIKL